jgi:hypothetical protein
LAVHGCKIFLILILTDTTQVGLLDRLRAEPTFDKLATVTKKINIYGAPNPTAKAICHMKPSYNE